MSPYDIAALVLILGSAASGYARGGVRELVGLVAFTLAALFALLLLPVTGPVFRHMIHPTWIGVFAAFAVVLVVAHMAIRTLGGAISKRLHDTAALGQIDRLVGLGFGMARALLLLGVFHLLFAAITPPDRRPDWFRNAAVYPVSRAVAKTIQAVLPKGAKVADRFAPRLEASVRRGASDSPEAAPNSSANPPARRVYADPDRARLDALVEKSR